jgi:hypothetical protein
MPTVIHGGLFLGGWAEVQVPEWEHDRATPAADARVDYPYPQHRVLSG